MVFISFLVYVEAFSKFRILLAAILYIRLVYLWGSNIFFYKIMYAKVNLYKRFSQKFCKINRKILMSGLLF